MVVGQFVTKQTWLLDGVEVKGIVRHPELQDGDEVGTRDDFALQPDDNYGHLIGSFPANSSLGIWCETYPLPPDHVNRDQRWPIEKKPDDRKFELSNVVNPSTGQPEPLKVGMHVRLLGRWTIDHHPESCVTRARGWLRVGCAHTELHPFRWDDIQLVVPPKPGELNAEILSLAAPLHEEVYLGGWKWFANEVAGVSSKIFISDDGSNYHNTLSASTRITAPALPAGFNPHQSLVFYREEVLRNGTSQSRAQLRTVTVLNNGIQVTAQVSAPTTLRFDSLSIASVNDPANLRSVFQARYSVGWLPRLATVERIDLVAPAVGSTTPFQLTATNRGPDPVQVTSVTIEGDPEGVFQFDPFAPSAVAPGATVTLVGRFVPTRPATFSAVLAIDSNDPAHGRIEVALQGQTTGAPSGRLAVNVEPRSITLGTRITVTVTARDSGNQELVPGTVTISNFDTDGNEITSQHPTNAPFEVILRSAREWDPETRQWLRGDPPSGVVNATVGYQLDRDKPVPFHFD
jgi:hypothetical protein